MGEITQKTDARDISLFELLNTKKYIVDYFQREYKWQKKHIEQLIFDLQDAFLFNYRDEHSREDVQNYDTYFMGPIILYEKKDGFSIIDGQQRLTSLTLLLIYIHNLQKNREDKEDIDTLIFSKKFSKLSYNIAIPERQHLLDSLYNEDKYLKNDNENNLSIINMTDRYNDIKDLFPEELKCEKLPFFIDWLKEKLQFVKIVAYSDRNAYTIFETMNDRGYNLTPSEMLKSYLISKVHPDSQDELNELWRKQISELQSNGIDEDLEFFRAWLRGKYADTIRQTAAGATNEDFEKIGTSFHRWVKDKAKSINLTTEQQFYYFIKSDFVFYSNIYSKIKFIERHNIEGLELLKYSTEWTIAGSLSYPLYIAPINKIDDDNTINKKLSIISSFIEKYVVLRSANRMSISQTSIRYAIYNLVKKIRGKDASELEKELNDFILSLKEQFEGIKYITTYNTNRKFIKYLLARITLYLSNYCNEQIDFYDLITARRKNGCQISNTIESEYQNHQEEFSTEEKFNDAINNIGSLALLRKDLRMDSRDANILFRISTNRLTNEERKKLEMKLSLPTSFDFSQEWLIQRQNLLIEICKKIWSIQ